MPVEFALEPLVIFLSMISGIVVGFSLGLIGGGGSVLAVPLLLYVVGVRDVHAAIGTSALAVGAIAAINLIGHKKKNHVRFRQGITFAIPGLGGTLLGAQLGLLTPSESLLIFFAGFMGIVGVLLLKKKAAKQDVQTSSNQTTVLLSKRNLPLSGFFGIGGGFLIVPTLMYSGGLSIVEAVGTSLVSVSAFGFSTASSYLVSGNIDLYTAGIFVVGGVIGGIVGIKMMGKIPQEILTKIFGIMVISISGYMLLMSLFF